MIVKRTREAIKFITDGWDLLDIPYSVKHGTYTTTLDSEMGKHKFVVNNYSNRVFIARNKVKKDVMNSDLAQQVMSTDYAKVNFGVDDKLKSFHLDKVYNIDLSSAYVYAIYNSGMISKETFLYLQSLKKGERLPSLGMLASAHTNFTFQSGKCIDYKVHREPTAPIFYLLIQEINDIMEECRWILGSDYIFHWVDGIFFRYDTPQKKIAMVEEVLQEFQFPYKYESCENFSFHKNQENFVISMVKNGERKKYNFGHREDYQRIKRYLTECVKGKVHSL